MKTKLEKLSHDFHNHLHDYGMFKEAFKVRGKNHEDNATAMRDFAQVVNKLMDKISLLEKKEAVQDVIIENNTIILNKFDSFSQEVLKEMNNIKTAITESATRRITWWHTFIGFGIIVTAIKYIYELIK